MTIQNFFHLLTILFCGLIAGLLYGYSCSVNGGLHTLANNEYIKAMQGINMAIQNPLFFVTFIGLLFIFPVTTCFIYKPSFNTSFYCMFAAMIIYFVGVFGITLFFNVPLNDQLAKFSILTATPDEMAAMRSTFEQTWNSYHLVRTVAAIISFGLTLLSILQK